MRCYICQRHRRDTPRNQHPQSELYHLCGPPCFLAESRGLPRVATYGNDSFQPGSANSIGANRQAAHCRPAVRKIAMPIAGVAAVVVRSPSSGRRPGCLGIVRASLGSGQHSTARRKTGFLTPNIGQQGWSSYVGS